MLIHQKLWLVHDLCPSTGFIEYTARDLVISETDGLSMDRHDGDTDYWVVLPNWIGGEWCEDHDRVAPFESRAEALTHLRNLRHTCLEGAPLYEDRF
jgi:hypothetical protein